jgi:uncharacterized membrane protein
MDIPSKKRRIEFIDLLRGWAVLVMIETHVADATLTAEITSSDFFQVLKFINGLVAPSFLFASGMAYAVTSRRKLNDYLSFGPPLIKQVLRLLLILLVGYALHLPKFNYYHLRYIAGDRAWEIFFQVDVLHCIAVSLLIAQGLLLVLRTEFRLYASLLGITIGILLLTPVVWGINFENFMPVPLAAYMNGLHDSLFPLFPWSAFLFSGSVTGWFYLRAKDREAAGDAGAVVRLMKKAVWIALGLAALSFVLHPIAEHLYPTYDYWKTSASFVLLRISLVLVLCALMFAVERRRGVSPRSAVSLVGRESLIVYVVHLLMIYGNFGTFNFHDRVNGTFGYLQAALTTVFLIGLMILLAWVWSELKSGPSLRKRAVQLSVAVVLAGVFFFGPPL